MAVDRAARMTCACTQRLPAGPDSACDLRRMVTVEPRFPAGPARLPEQAFAFQQHRVRFRLPAAHAGGVRSPAGAQRQRSSAGVAGGRLAVLLRLVGHPLRPAVAVQHRPQFRRGAAAGRRWPSGADAADAADAGRRLQCADDRTVQISAFLRQHGVLGRRGRDPHDGVRAAAGDQFLHLPANRLSGGGLSRPLPAGTAADVHAVHHFLRPPDRRADRALRRPRAAVPAPASGRTGGRQPGGRAHHLRGRPVQETDAGRYDRAAHRRGLCRGSAWRRA